MNAKTAPPFLMASLRSASEEERNSLIWSKASEAGKDSGRRTSCQLRHRRDSGSRDVPSLRDIVVVIC